MSNQSDGKRNYTDPKQSGADSSIERVGDLTGEPPANYALNRDTTSKLANLLEDLKFPASKEDIKNHLNKKSPAMGNRINDVIEAIQNNLNDNTSYENVYSIELDAGLVEKKWYRKNL